jgi:hypothetical protein
VKLFLKVSIALRHCNKTTRKKARCHRARRNAAAQRRCLMTGHLNSKSLHKIAALPVGAADNAFTARRISAAFSTDKSRGGFFPSRTGEIGQANAWPSFSRRSSANFQSQQNFSACRRRQSGPGLSGRPWRASSWPCRPSSSASSCLASGRTAPAGGSLPEPARRPRRRYGACARP